MTCECACVHCGARLNGEGEIMLSAGSRGICQKQTNQRGGDLGQRMGEGWRAWFHATGLIHHSKLVVTSSGDER